MFLFYVVGCSLLFHSLRVFNLEYLSNIFTNYANTVNELSTIFNKYLKTDYPTQTSFGKPVNTRYSKNIFQLITGIVLILLYINNRPNEVYLVVSGIGIGLLFNTVTTIITVIKQYRSVLNISSSYIDTAKAVVKIILRDKQTDMKRKLDQLVDELNYTCISIGLFKWALIIITVFLFIISLTSMIQFFNL